MEFNVMLLSALRFTSKTSGKKLVRMDYIFTDKDTKSNGDNARGYFPQACFSENLEVLDIIPMEWYGKQMIAICEERSYPNNPLETRKVITKLKFDEKVINLL